MLTTKQEVDRLRNTLRFLAGNLQHEFDLLDINDMKLVDRFMLHQLQNLYQNLKKSYDSMAYNKVCVTLQHFIANDLSGFYLSTVKDRLYCEPKLSKQRLSALTTLSWLMEYLTKTLSPIVPVLIHEVGLHHPELKIDLSKALGKHHLQWVDGELCKNMQVILDIRKAIHGANVTKSDAVFLPAQIAKLGFTPEDLLEIFQVAQVHFSSEINDESESFLVQVNEDLSLIFKPSLREICPRCRLCSSLIHGELCPRCQEVVKEINV